jgi:hypothetical protein
MDDDGGCEVCAMWRELANFKSDGAKRLRFLMVASDGSRDSLVRASSLSARIHSAASGAAPGKCSRDSEGICSDHPLLD